MKRATVIALALLLPACVDEPDAFDAEHFAADESDDPQTDADADSDPAETEPAAGGEASCAPTEARLIAGEQSNAGGVVITSTADGLQIDLETNGRWRLNSVHAFAGDVPPNDGDALAPERFPFSAQLDQARSHQLLIPRAELPAGACGEELTVAVHADVVRVRGEEIEQTLTAWAVGDDGVEPGWGAELTVAVCCD